MLDKIRENSRSPITFITFGIIILVFVAYFGPGSQGCMGLGGADAGPTAYAAKVNGAEITTREFQTAYAAYYESYRRQSGGAFTPEMAEQMKLKDTVLDRLVEQKLLVELAKAHGLAVGDEEVATELRKIPAFQKNGVFDFETYKGYVENGLGMAPEKFEEQVRGDLLKDKMLAQIRQGAKATDDEVKTEYERDNDRASLSFVRFTVPMFRLEAAPTPEEIEAFIASEDGKKQLEEDYKKKSFRFKKPKRVKAQHILVKVAEGAPQAELDAAKAKLEEAKKQLEGGKDFGELAKELSEDPGSKDKGGDLGFFGLGTMDKPFEQAAMALEPGKLSDVVRSRFGFHLIKVNEVQPAEEKKLEEVQEELAKELLAAEKAKRVAREKAEAALAAAQAGKSLADQFPAPEGERPAPAGQAPVVEETGLFAVGNEYVPRIGVSGELSRAVAALEQPGQVLPQVYEVGGSQIVAQLKERKRPDPAEFEKRKAEYRDRLLAKKQGALVEGFLTTLRKEATVETNPEMFAGRAPADGESDT